MAHQECQPSLCTNGCGFFGSASLDGMCSKCFKTKTQQSHSHDFPHTDGFSAPTTSRQAKREEVDDSHNSRPEQRQQEKNEEPIPRLGLNENTSKKNENKSDEKRENVPTGRLLTPPLKQPAEDNQDENSSDGVKRMKLSTNEGDLPPLEDSADADQARSPSKDRRGSKEVTRCKECNKKVGLTGYNCRCGGMFCAQHRYSDIHKCDFDYRTMAEKELRKNNPVVKGDKIQKL